MKNLVNAIVLLSAYAVAVHGDSGSNNTTCASHYLEINRILIPIRGVFLESSPDLTHRYLQPRNGTPCLANTTGQECCYDACASKPCFNSGECLPGEGNNTFKCECSSNFFGNWCQTHKDCKMCGPNTHCKEDGKCSCNDGFAGNDDGTGCTAQCANFNISTSDLSKECHRFPFLVFTGIGEDFTAYSQVNCSGRPFASIRCDKDNFAGATTFNEKSITCVPCKLNLTNFLDQKEPNNTEDIKKDLSKLKVLTKSENISEVEIKTIVDRLKNMSALMLDKNLTIDAKSLENLLDVTQNLDEELDDTENSGFTQDKIEGIAPAASKRDITIRDSISQMGSVIDTVARSVDLDGEESNKTIRVGKITVEIIVPKIEQENLTLTLDTYIKGKGDTNRPQIKSQKAINVTIPTEAMHAMRKFIKDDEIGTLKLVFVLYQDATHLTVDRRTGQVIQGNYRTGEGNDAIPLGITIIISFLQPPTPTKKQRDVLKGTLRVIHKEYFCVFWDYVRKEWSTAGCKYYHEAGNGLSRCECTHFTSFALLLRSTVRFQDFKKSYYSIVASGISAFCLCITAAIYVAVKELRSRRPTPILVNICINLSIGYIIFIVGMDGRQKMFSDSWCYASAVIMHMSFLSAWFWILVYSLNMYYAVVIVPMVVPFVGKKVFMYLVGYGTPFVIVASDLISSLLIDYYNPKKINDADFLDTYIASHVCWLRQYAMYLGFAAPVGIILAVNIVLIIFIMKRLNERQNIRSSREDATKSQQVYTAITMMAMMGITWIFGYVMLISPDPTFQNVFSNLFNIFNTTQGLVIFLVSCVRQPAVRDLWLRPTMKALGCCLNTDKAKESKQSLTDLSHVSTTKATPSRIQNEYSSTTTL